MPRTSLSDRFTVGSIVYVDDPYGTRPVRFSGAWTVVKVNQRTYQLEQNGRRLNCDKYLCLPEPPDGAVTTIHTHYVLGQVVKYTGPQTDRLTTEVTKLVVLKDNGDRVRVTILGGDGDRYWNMTKRHVRALRPRRANAIQ